MIYFVGAGPGDPELMTVKGARLVSSADVIVYAGSLVSQAVLEGCKPNAQLYNSAGMNFDEVMEVMVKAGREKRTVVRLHTGDPAIYGAIQEQMDALVQEDLPFEVVPGVSSVFAAAAAIPHELTLPGLTQTVIMTRLEGRTPVPEREKLRELARHQCTLCIFLSINQIEQVVAELLEGGFDPDTGVVVVEKASWPDQRVLKGTIKNAVKMVKEAGITRQALILVSNVFDSDYQRSKLYDQNFSHGFRGQVE